MNSFHHQAVDRVGFGLRAVAWAPDGTVEGIEGEGERLVIGVQWHAETLDGGPHPRLFAALVEAARGQPRGVITTSDASLLTRIAKSTR